MKETVVARWQDWSRSGLEHLVLGEDETGFHAESVVVAETDGPPKKFYGVRYRIRCDHEWRVRETEVVVTGGPRLTLTCDGQGAWRDASGMPLPDLAGAIDVDLTATPFTNTLPICRLGLLAGESREIPVAWILCPELTVIRTMQRYTCLEPGRLYRFESIESGFVREVTVDDRGLVTLYPDLFRRVL